MAFHQQTRQAIQRPARDASEERGDSHVPTAPILEESQTWVLFSPTADTATTSSVLDSLPPSSQQTAGRSRLSDLGSLRSLAPSNYGSSRIQPAYAGPAHWQPSTSEDAALSEDDRQDAEDDAELDSLDSHLPDFRPTQSTSQAQQMQMTSHMHMTTTTATTAATPITTVNLPAHDGFGSFRLGNTAGMGPAAVQEHLYMFEQFNPRRVTKRRRESLDLAQLETEHELAEDMERTRRIEAWRWEHSRVLLEEIQNETRRRRGSEMLARRSRSGSTPGAVVPAAAAVATSKAAEGDVVQAELNGEWHDQEENDQLSWLRRSGKGDNSEGDDEPEGLWSRITRKFMLEVMGIDDHILSMLFGEALADEDEIGEAMAVDLSVTPKASSPLENRAGGDSEDATADDALHGTESSSWQLRMLERIARELGMFVHNHMSAHPGAFSTYSRVQQMPLPYAGLPVIPETMTAAATATLEPDGDAVGADVGHNEIEESAADVTPTGTTASLPRFTPTIYQARAADMGGLAAESAKAAPVGGAGSTAARSASGASATVSASAPTFTQDEWEQDLDIKLVFRYLRSRFFSDSGATSGHTHRHHAHHHTQHGSGGGSSSTMSAQEAAAKAARVRQHHPLVGRGNGSGGRVGAERRSGAVPAFRGVGGVSGVGTVGPGGGAAIATPSSPPMVTGLRAATSCASQSTRRSARRSSMSSRHSSRHYWDIGGSIGTGSMIASAGPMGSWGEV